MADWSRVALTLVMLESSTMMLQSWTVGAEDGPGWSKMFLTACFLALFETALSSAFLFLADEVGIGDGILLWLFTVKSVMTG